MDPLLQKIKDLQQQLDETKFKENCIEDVLCRTQLKYDLKMTLKKYQVQRQRK